MQTIFSKCLAALCIAGCLFSGAAHAQIPVTDATSITASVQHQVETMVKWKQQYDQLTRQITQQAQQYNAITGSRGLGTIMNNPALREYLPADWKGVYDKVRTGGYAGLTGSAKSIADANRLFDNCAHMAVTAQRLNCEANAAKGAQDKAFALDAYKASQARLDQIDQLMQSINNTTDAKAIAELQGRIAAEQAMIQNEQTKLQMYAMVAASEDRLQQQRQRELDAKALAMRGWPKQKPIQFEPVQFGER